MIRTLRATVGIATAVLATVSVWQGVAATRAGAAEPAAAQTRLTLYERLGGGPALTAVVEDLLGRCVADKRISAKLVNADLARLRAQLVDQLCALTGGPCR